MFRLYYVDSPETYGTHSERVLAQARHFGLDPEQTIEIGKQATEFTLRKLKKNFTIYTRWRHALGNSTPSRHFAFVQTADGTDLGCQLARKGLVRVHGVSIGRKYQIPMQGITKGAYKHALYSARKKARGEHLGSWQNW